MKNIDNSNRPEWPTIAILPQRADHGWPVTFMTRVQDRRTSRDDGELNWIRDTELLPRYAFQGGIVREISALSMLIDIVVGVAITLGAAWSARMVASQFASAPKFTLKGLFASIAFVGSAVVILREERIDWPYAISIMGVMLGLLLAWYAVIDVAGVLLEKAIANNGRLHESKPEARK